MRWDLEQRETVSQSLLVKRRAAKGSKRITKAEWNAAGGLANSKLWRRQSKGGSWKYYETLD